MKGRAEGRLSMMTGTWPATASFSAGPAPRTRPLMAAMDACNARWGRGAVVPARAGLVSRRDWNTKFEMRTPRYTTQVGELPVAVA